MAGYDRGIDIVVVNYQTSADLRRFLASLEQNRPTIPFTVVVMNVCPQSEDMEAARTATKAHYGALSVSKADNVGYARACNEGASYGHSEVVALFNADVALSEGAIDECHAALMANPEWGVLGPRQVDDLNRLTHAGIFGTPESPYINHWMQKDLGGHDEVREAVSVSGSAYFVRRECWDQLRACPTFQTIAPAAEGAFLPTQHSYEETWCSYHAADHGWKVIYYGPVKIIHQFHKASEIGGWADRQVPLSQAFFRSACDSHDLAHD